MKKYIDAERLIKAIEDKGLDCSFALKMERLDTLALIDSLQQEQRETDGDYGKFVKILVRKEFAEQIQKLGDEIQAGQSSFVGAMNQQKHPEVNLEKEIEEYWSTMGWNKVIELRKFKPIARYFYGLGQLNSK